MIAPHPKKTKAGRPLVLVILCGMILAVSALLFLRQEPSVAHLDQLARARDVAGLTAQAENGAWKGRNPFNVLRTNSAYDTGRFGWTAIAGKAPWGQDYVVFSTPLTSEDVGERLFEWNGKKLRRFVDEREDFGWRIDRHALVITFDIPAKRVSISDTLDVRSAGKSPNLMVRLSPHYRVTAVTRPSGNLPWKQLGGIVMIGGAKDGDKVRLEYSGIVDKPGYAGAIRPNEAMLTNDYWYPMIARKPAKFSAIVRGPENWSAVTNGDQTGTQVKNGVRETVFDMPVPISYWSLNIGPYKNVSEQIEGRRYQCWSQTLTDAQMQKQPKFFPLIIKTFETFAPYPFNGYGAVVTQLYGGGALEGYSFVTSGYYSGEDAHEVAHTWFGGLVNNTYLTSMWNESFAVWGSGYYLRNAPLGNKEDRWLAYIQTPQIDEHAYNLAPLNDAPAEIGPEANTLGYGKGAYVLQMLEQELGTPAFVNACKDWLKTQDKTRGGEWEDFEAAVQRTSGRDLKWFFDQWVRRPGFADFDIRDVRFENGAVVGQVDFQGTPYRITCEVLAEIAGKQSFHKVELKQGAFRLPLATKPTFVSFDPWRRIVRKIDANEAPTTIEAELRRFRRIDVRSSRNWLTGVGQPSSSPVSANLENLFLVGLPQDSAQLRDLYQRAGVRVEGTKATYDGTVFDLEKGGFVALIDLPGGGRCAIGAGKIEHTPIFGNTRLMVFDELGRFLRGITEPKTSGRFVFRL